MFDLLTSFQHLYPALQSPFGYIFFVLIYTLWVCFLLPGLWLSMLAGALYGTLLGSLLVFLGAFIGAEISFFLGRNLLRDWVQSRIIKIPRLHTLQKAVLSQGLKFIVLTRLSPAFPFSLLNFAYGLSKVKLIDYTIGLIAIIPGTILFCGLGSLAGDIASFKEILSNDSNPQLTLFKIIGLIATLGVVWLLARSSRLALQDIDTI